ncbi:MAG: AraC family transcriptional regulator [Hyphomicrobiales bacterium]|nr:GlxA family transcriptional regulator [Hyphomicrobiales bacterium]PCJ82461.1 MAG: AraC family transcriptional regulator [Hyphomicrobiales bacterium]
MTRFGFLIIDQFSLFNLAAMLDPLRVANHMCERDVYQWTTCSVTGEPSWSSSNTSFNVDYALADLPQCDILMVCAGFETDPENVAQIHAQLRLRERRGTKLGAISTGSIILASGGMLDGYRCTIHWEYEAAFRERFPEVDCTGRVFEIDRNRITSSGGTASLDLALNLIAAEISDDVAYQVANQFQHERIRQSDECQRAGKNRDFSTKPTKLTQVIALMEKQLEEPVATTELARSVSLSVRQVERLFLKYLSCTPSKYYMGLRLERSRELLRQTNSPIIDVALASGFSSHSYFAQSYRNYFSRSPSEERRLVW